MPTRRNFLMTMAAGPLALPLKSEAAIVVRSARSGDWSSPSTWENNQVPMAGAKVQILAGHTVNYDRSSSDPIRMVHIAGTLSFTRGKDTRIDVWLIKIRAP